MTSPRTLCPTLTLLAGLVFAGAGAAAGPSAVLVRSGGATVDEFAEMNREARNYSMKLVLAAKGTGAYLADVDVTVRALPAREVVIEHRSEGPLLLATLPPGRYEVQASFKDVRPGAPTSVTRVLTVPQRGLVQAVLYFDTDDKVGDDSPAEFLTR